MIKVILVSVISALAVFAVFRLFIERNNDILKNNKIRNLFICTAVFTAFALRILISIRYRGNIYDMNCFSEWATKVYENGLSSYYKSGFADYPPGYVYVLYVLGWLKSIFGFSSTLIKLPPMIVDIICSLFVYKVASEKFSNTASALFACLYMFSPAVIFNSAMWGQVDVIHTTLIAAAVYLVTKKKLIAAYYVFALAVITKPQSLIFTPIFMIAFFEECILKPDKKKIIRHICCGFGALFMTVLIVLPFGLHEATAQYVSTLKAYPYATVNAYNIYGALRLNWAELTPVISFFGTLFIVCTVFYVFYYYYKGNRNLFFLSGVIMFMTFMLSVKMHERYAYPAMLMFLMAYIQSESKEARNMFALTTFSQLVNVLCILTVNKNEATAYQKEMFMVVFSVVNIAIMGYMFYACHKLSGNNIQRNNT